MASTDEGFKREEVWAEPALAQARKFRSRNGQGPDVSVRALMVELSGVEPLTS
jgi:hypothetical protein